MQLFAGIGEKKNPDFHFLTQIISNGQEPKPAELLASLRGQRMKAIKNLNQLNFVTEGKAFCIIYPFVNKLLITKSIFIGLLKTGPHHNRIYLSAYGKIEVKQTPN